MVYSDIWAPGSQQQVSRSLDTGCSAVSAASLTAATCFHRRYWNWHMFYDCFPRNHLCFSLPSDGDSMQVVCPDCNSVLMWIDWGLMGWGYTASQSETVKLLLTNNWNSPNNLSIWNVNYWKGIDRNRRYWRTSVFFIENHPWHTWHSDVFL